MTTLEQAREGLETRLGTIDGLRVIDHLADDINPPAAVILPPVIPDYRDDLGVGSVTATFPVLLVVPATLARQQLDLYAYLDRSGPLSIFATIEADRTLGGLNVDARAVNVEDFDLTRFGVINYYARAVNVEVLIS